MLLGFSACPLMLQERLTNLRPAEVLSQKQNPAEVRELPRRGSGSDAEGT